MSDFKFDCPHCQQRMQVNAQHAGRQTECPSCHHLIRIPPPPGANVEEFKPQSGMTWDTFIPKTPGEDKK